MIPKERGLKTEEERRKSGGGKKWVELVAIENKRRSEGRKSIHKGDRMSLERKRGGTDKGRASQNRDDRGDENTSVEKSEGRKYRRGDRA